MSRCGLLDAALAGEFDEVPTVEHPILGLTMPATCDAVPDEMLNPRNTWDDPAAYDAAAERLRDLFRKNYEAEGYAGLGIAATM